MTDEQPDRLAEIRQRRAATADWHEDFGDDMHRCKVCGDEETIWDGICHEPGCPVKAAFAARQGDLDWLIAEVERLRGLLDTLEWAGRTDSGPGQHGEPCCPVCDAEERDPHGHGSTCWLPKELRSTSGEGR